ncbi:hypothetical protein T492DRAFT_939966 [Pavlovales sp. CCMP2436]|nr:hypothetical protein T492DRAFT_939966 [Pavlovales sp. CCMP2436]
MNQVKYVEGINKRELAAAAKKGGAWEIRGSWHEKYKDSAYVFVAGFPYEMTEGDLVVVFSQYGEVVDINLARDKATGKSKGFAFLAYEDTRSTVLAVDNFNGAKLIGRTLRVDHCENYNEEQEKMAKEDDKGRELTNEDAAKETQRLAHNEAIRARRESKASLFATERGELSAEDAALADAVARAAAARETKEREVRQRMRERIEATHRAHRAEVDAELGEEERKEKEYREKRARRDEEKMRAAKQAATGAAPVPVRDSSAPPPANVDAGDGGAAQRDADARFARLFGGGGKKKKSKKEKGDKREREGADVAREQREGTGERPAKKVGEDSMSIAETNAMRANLGLLPLRG